MIPAPSVCSWRRFWIEHLLSPSGSMERRSTSWSKKDNGRTESSRTWRKSTQRWPTAWTTYSQIAWRYSLPLLVYVQNKSLSTTSSLNKYTANTLTHYISTSISSVSVFVVFRWPIMCTTALLWSICLTSCRRTLAAAEASALCSTILSTASRTCSPLWWEWAGTSSVPWAPWWTWTVTLFPMRVGFSVRFNVFIQKLSRELSAAESHML